MLICKQCWLAENPDEADEPFSEWLQAPKVYEQCEICQRSTLCAEI